MQSKFWRHLETRTSRTWQSGNCQGILAMSSLFTPSISLCNGLQATQTSQEIKQADRLANQGARCLQQNNTASMDTARQIIKQNKNQDLRNESAQNDTGWFMFMHMITPNIKDHINTLSREEQVTIFWPRSHVPLNSHFKRIGVVTESRCLCPDETVAHHLFDCTHWV